ncbi:hypothetical protein AG4045_004560 [Apium graveolens]|uniref:Protein DETOXIFICATION n=1 Tax=Apium graveolens TaxID=4045 RepID=A0A6L5B8F8_APIGR|nr:hypothetical protein AG4045_004560 [Apium graveolens]
MGRRHYRSSDSSSDDDDKIINNKKRGRDEQQHVEVDSDSKLTKKNVSVRDEDDKVVERDRKRDEDDEEIDRRGKSTRGDRYRDRDRDRKRVYGRDGRRYDEDRFRSSRGEDDKNGRHRSSRRRDEFDGRDGGRSRYSDGDELEEGQIRKTSEEEDDRRSELRNKRDRRDKDDVRSFTKDKGADYSKDDGRLGKGGGATNVEAPLPPPPPPPQDNLSVGRTGGVYIPPFKLARMLKQVEDKSSVEYQRLTWDALRKSINGLVNKVNATNIKNIIPELFAENLIRGRGLFCRSCIKSQMASPGFTDVFAALVAVVNTKFPQVGDLLLRRIVLQLQRAYKRNDKPQLLAAVKFIAHLVNQQIVHELVALELLTTLLENPTDDSVEVAVGFVTQCGSILQDLCPRGLHGIFERFRGILHEGEIDKRVQFLIEGLFAIRKAKFQGYPAIRPELDLVEQEDQLTHEISLLDQIDPEIALDIFKPDPQFVENEQRYEELKKTLLGEESEDEADSDAATDNEDDEEGEDDESDEEQMRIRDETETNLVNLRRTIYLTIMSSVDFEEAGHKLMKIKLEPGQEVMSSVFFLSACFSCSLLVFLCAIPSVQTELIRLSIPAIAGQAIEPLAQLMETAYIGRLGSLELASAGVSISIFNIISKVFNIPLLSVTTSFVAEDISKHSTEGFSSAERMQLPSVSTALVLSIGIGILEATALYLGSGMFLSIMGISTASPMRTSAHHFLQLRALGCPAVVLSLAIQGIFRGFKDTETPVKCLALGNTAAVFLFPALMYVFHLGVTGAAISSIISQYTVTLSMIWHLNKRTILVPDFEKLQFGGYLKSGGFLLGRTLAAVMTVTLSTSMAARQGPLSMAAHQIILQVWLSTSLLADAQSSSSQAGLFTGILLAIILSLSFGSLATLFTKDVEVLNIVRSGLLFISASQPITALAYIFDGLHYGISDFMFAACSMMVVGALASAFLLWAPPLIGLSGVWSGLTLFMALRTVAGLMRLSSKNGPWWFLQDIQGTEVAV